MSAQKAATAFSFYPFAFKLFPILIFDLCIRQLGIYPCFDLPNAATAAMDKHPFFKGCNDVIKRQGRDLGSVTYTHIHTDIYYCFTITFWNRTSGFSNEYIAYLLISWSWCNHRCAKDADGPCVCGRPITHFVCVYISFMLILCLYLHYIHRVVLI